MKQLYAIKRESNQVWTKAGLRIPVTVLRAQASVVMNVGEGKVQLGIGAREVKNLSKPVAGQLKKAGVKVGSKMFRTIATEKTDFEVGGMVPPSSVLQPGDIVTATGTSKGTGFTGGMKLHGFHGGPRTHGQSDRARAPGASASGTTPGRLFRGKRMAARGGSKTVSVMNLTVVGVDDSTGEILVKGVVPGVINSMVRLTKTGEAKFDGLYSAKTDTAVIETEPAPKEELEAKEPERRAEAKKVDTDHDAEKPKAEEQAEKAKDEPKA